MNDVNWDFLFGFILGWLAAYLPQILMKYYIYK